MSRKLSPDFVEFEPQYLWLKDVRMIYRHFLWWQPPRKKGQIRNKNENSTKSENSMREKLSSHQVSWNQLISSLSVECFTKNWNKFPNKVVHFQLRGSFKAPPIFDQSNCCVSKHTTLMQPTPLRVAIHPETPPSAPTSCSVRVCQTCGWRPRPLAVDFSVTPLRVWPCSQTRSRRQQQTTPTTTTPPTAPAPRTTHHCKRNMTNL